MISGINGNPYYDYASQISAILAGLLPSASSSQSGTFFPGLGQPPSPAQLERQQSLEGLQNSVEQLQKLRASKPTGTLSRLTGRVAGHNRQVQQMEKEIRQRAVALGFSEDRINQLLNSNSAQANQFLSSNGGAQAINVGGRPTRGSVPRGGTPVASSNPTIANFGGSNQMNFGNLSGNLGVFPQTGQTGGGRGVTTRITQDIPTGMGATQAARSPNSGAQYGQVFGNAVYNMSGGGLVRSGDPNKVLQNAAASNAVGLAIAILNQNLSGSSKNLYAKG